MKGLTFVRHDVGTLYFTEHAARKMLAHRQHDARGREAGGVLLGRHLLDSDDLIVDDVTEPARTDRRCWAGFFRSLAHHTLALDRWRRSGGTCAYLGSWHTHPEADPRPSPADMADWQHALSLDRYDGHSLFFAIVGIERVRVWQGWRNSETREIQLRDRKG